MTRVVILLKLVKEGLTSAVAKSREFPWLEPCTQILMCTSLMTP